LAIQDVQVDLVHREIAPQVAEHALNRDPSVQAAADFQRYFPEKLVPINAHGHLRSSASKLPSPVEGLIQVPGSATMVGLGSCGGPFQVIEVQHSSLHTGKWKGILSDRSGDVSSRITVFGKTPYIAIMFYSNYQIW
jgi:hypothetical protein